MACRTATPRAVWRLAMGAMALTAALWLAAPGARAQTLDAPAPSSSQWREEQLGPKPDWSWLVVLRFVTETDYPPFNYYDEDGILTGFNVDLARAICAELEVTCEVNPGEWSGLVRSVTAEEADAVIASLSINPTSIEQVDFTDGYYATPAKFVTRSSSELSEITPEALDGVKVGVIKDTAHERYLRDFFTEAKIVAFDSDEALRGALKGGQVEAIFGDAISLMFWVNGQDAEGCCQFRGRGFLEARYFGEGVGIAVAKGNIRLKEVLNYALARVRNSGRFEELLLRYFPLSIY
jgi:polar amino acid transport system substrate-binding protein